MALEEIKVALVGPRVFPNLTVWRMVLVIDTLASITPCGLCCCEVMCHIWCLYRCWHILLTVQKCELNKPLHKVPSLWYFVRATKRWTNPSPSSISFSNIPIFKYRYPYSQESHVPTVLLLYEPWLIFQKKYAVTQMQEDYLLSFPCIMITMNKWHVSVTNGLHVCSGMWLNFRGCL